MAQAAQQLYCCLKCALQKSELNTLGSIISATEHFQARQDYAVPIPGFVVITSKRHIQSIDEFTSAERTDFIEFVYVMRKRMRCALKIETIYMIHEEDDLHFHLWLFPRYEWMKQFGNISIKPIMKWASENLITQENLNAVIEAVEKLKD